MKIYYLNNAVGEIRLDDEKIADLLNAVVHAIRTANLNTYLQYTDMVYRIGRRLPTETPDEKAASALILKLLLSNREAIMGLNSCEEFMGIFMIGSELVAVVDEG